MTHTRKKDFSVKVKLFRLLRQKKSPTPLVDGNHPFSYDNSLPDEREFPALMFASCLLKQEAIKDEFKQCADAESKYKKIIDIGRSTAAMHPKYKLPENIVKGCQSTMYMRSWSDEGKIYFEVDSDALISKGLAVLLIRVYSGENAETILKCPPLYLEEMGINASLTLNRANGLASIYLHMKRAALAFLVYNAQLPPNP